MQDKLMPIIVVEDPAELQDILVRVLGFEEGLTISEDGAQMAVYTYGSSNIAVATHGVLPGLPEATGPAVYVLEVPDVEASRNVMVGRAEEAIGGLVQGFFGAYFDVADSHGHIFRFLQKSTEIAYDGV